MVLKDPAPICHYNYSKDSSINFFVRVWVLGANYWALTWDLNEQLTRTLMEKGVNIPFPQVTVSYRKEEEK
jgi:small conductance mechanosensitive channel